MPAFPAYAVGAEKPVRRQITFDFPRPRAWRLQCMVTAAEERGIKVAYEFHPNTLSETLEGTLDLLRAVEHPNLYTYWQPPSNTPLDQQLEIDQLFAFSGRLFGSLDVCFGGTVADFAVNTDFVPCGLIRERHPVQRD